MKSKLRNFPFLLYLHIFLTGLAVSVIAFIGLRQSALVIGEHVIALCILMTAFLLNIAIGSRFFGKRSDRTSNLLRFMVLLELGISLYAFASPLLGIAFSRISDLLAVHSGAGTFRISLYRFMLLVVFLLPMTFAGALIPVYSKYMIRHVSHIGRKSGIVFALISFGTLAGSCIAGFYLIQQYGYTVSQMISALLLLVNAGLLMLYRARRPVAAAEIREWSLAMKARRSGLTVLKNRFVLEAEAKLIHTLLWVFAIQGFVAMSFAILWTRTLTDLLKSDNSDVLVAIVLAVLSGLAIGSLLFRGMADKPRKRFYLLGLTEILTGLSAALSYVVMYLLLSQARQDPGSAPSFTEGIPLEMILTTVLIFLPALFTGASFPISCRLYPKRIQRIGRRIGWLGSVFLLGAAMSLFLTNFIVIPLIGVYTTFFFFVIFSILIGLILFLRDSRFKRAFRLFILMLAVAMIVLLQALFSKQNYNIHAFDLMPQDSILVKKEGSTASVFLIERSEGYNDLMINGDIVMHTDGEHIKTQQFLAYLPGLFTGETESAYLAGFGLGVTASSLEMCGFKKINITETSPEVISVTSSAFAELNNDILTNQAVSISIEDSRSFLHRSADQFDIITFSYSYPLTKSSYYSREFYKLCHDRLDENGVLCQALPLSWVGSQANRAVLKTCSSVFADLSLWYTGTDRILLLAFRDKPSRDFCVLKQRFDLLNADQKMTRIGLPITEALLSCLVYDDPHIREMTEDFYDITDNRPLWTMDLQEDSLEVMQPPDFLRGSQVNYAQWLDLSGNCVVSERYILNIIDSYKMILLGETGN